jgi:hypothetical protein
MTSTGSITGGCANSSGASGGVDAMAHLPKLGIDHLQMLVEPDRPIIEPNVVVGAQAEHIGQHIGPFAGSTSGRMCAAEASAIGSEGGARSGCCLASASWQACGCRGVVSEPPSGPE